jgi:hypothetical protein
MKVARIISRNVERLSKAARMLDKILCPYEDVARKCARNKSVGRVCRKVKCDMHFLCNKFQFRDAGSDHVTLALFKPRYLGEAYDLLMAKA